MLAVVALEQGYPLPLVVGNEADDPAEHGDERTSVVGAIDSTHGGSLRHARAREASESRRRPSPPRVSAHEFCDGPGGVQAPTPASLARTSSTIGAAPLAP